MKIPIAFKWKFLLLSLAVWTLCSCSDQEDMIISIEPNPIVNGNSRENEYSVSKANIKSILDELFPLTRTQENEPEIIPLMSDLRCPAYMVNVGENKGWAIVSATKTFYPVLAYCDNGDFKEVKDNPGFKFWIGYLGDVASELKNDEESLDHIAMQWNRYSGPTERIGSRINQTRSQDRQKALRIVADSMAQWQRLGYKCYTYNQWDRQGQFQKQLFSSVERNHPDSYDTDWKDETVIVEVKSTESEKYPNFVETGAWHQGIRFQNAGSYNQSFPVLSDGYPAYVGCGPLAIGQIMKYCKHPTYYNWSSIPTGYATRVTSDFLFDLAKRSKATYALTGTSTNSDDCIAVLREFGYTCTMTATKGDVTSATLKKVFEGLRGKKPIYIRGEDVKEGGHAWLVTGGNRVAYETLYKLYTYQEHPGYMYCGNWLRDIDSYYYLYMTWGWGGTDNGFYLIPNLKNSKGTFSKDVKYCIVKL